jgi:multidrug transporter EmrE-like cation transporter
MIEQRPTTMLRIGLVALLIANALHIALRWSHGIAETLVSVGMGMAYGISMTLLLLTARQKRQRQ